MGSVAVAVPRRPEFRGLVHGPAEVGLVAAEEGARPDELAVARGRRVEGGEVGVARALPARRDGPEPGIVGE